MDVRRGAAIAYAVISVGVFAFQLALAAGVPWGSFAMGGAFPGQFPPALRVAAVVQAGVISLQVAVVLSRAGVALAAWARVSRWLIWAVVGLGVVAFVLNVITPSSGERLIWAPTTFALLALALIVAVTSRAAERTAR